MHSTPQSLLERLREPDQPGAWDRFVKLYTPLIYYWLRRQGLQQADAADIVQEVFVTLVQRMPTFEYDRGRSFRNWLRTITLNKVRERQRKSEPMQATEQALDELPGDEAATSWEREYQEQLVQQALEFLRVEFRPATWQAFWQHGMLGRPAAAVAMELGLTPGGVRASKLRVVCRLRKELDGLLD